VTLQARLLAFAFIVQLQLAAQLLVLLLHCFQHIAMF
jgi:hypothetical protein